MAEYPEVVLNELWAQLEDAKFTGNDSNDDWKDNVPIWLLRSAYELLKEQEPAEPEKMTVLDFGEFTTTVYLCGACRMPIERGDVYCKHCGKKVKWDG